MAAHALGPDSLKPDCRWFKGWAPCAPHKAHGVHCMEPDGTSCGHYERVTERILIIKLGAIGDVIRTTPLLHALRQHHPGAQIWWVTLTPEVLPHDVDVPLPFSARSLATLSATPFALLINLDKDREACALATSLQARVKKGFIMHNGVPAPADPDAHHKYMTGLFDDLSKANTQSYLEETFAICGYRFAGEPYILDSHANDGYRWRIPRKRPVIGLNTGCGGRWTARLWPEKNWIALAQKLKRSGMTPLLLGGEQEHDQNRRIARRSGALYAGHFPLPQFINLVDQCDCVITAVTMAMHITIGLRKKLVLFNNIFNRHEFELYGLGKILEPAPACSCYFAPACTAPGRTPHGCMADISVAQVLTAVKTLLAT